MAKMEEYLHVEALRAGDANLYYVLGRFGLTGLASHFLSPCVGKVSVVKVSLKLAGMRV